ncbi:MAG: phage tail protein [Spirochaetes bacterium]|nr:phage tail protein [Spirochaetota bacterium]
MAEYNVALSSNFKVEIEGVDYGNFTSVTGIGGSSEITEDVGGMDKAGRKIPGKVKYDTVTITRNCDPADKVLRDWWKTVEDGNPEKKSVSVVFIARDGTTEVSRRDLHQCVPCGYHLSDLDSQNTNSLTESLTLAYETAAWQ